MSPRAPDQDRRPLSHPLSGYLSTPSPQASGLRLKSTQPCPFARLLAPKPTQSPGELSPCAALPLASCCPQIPCRGGHFRPLPWAPHSECTAPLQPACQAPTQADLSHILQGHQDCGLRGECEPLGGLPGRRRLGTHTPEGLPDDSSPCCEASGPLHPRRKQQRVARWRQPGQGAGGHNTII